MSCAEQRRVALDGSCQISAVHHPQANSRKARCSCLNIIDSTQHLAIQIISNLHHILQNRDDIQINIRWVPGHTEVMGNKMCKECSRATQLVSLCLRVPRIHQATDPAERPQGVAVPVGDYSRGQECCCIPGNPHYMDPPGSQPSF